MLINNSLVQLPNEYMEYEKGATGAFSESEFINNLMLNPAKYREFKRNINRINNIDNEINYIKSQEQKNQIDFVNNIKITEEEYQTAINNAKTLFDNLSEIQIADLLSHRKLLSNEKHLIEAMVYFLGIDNLDWNTFKLTFNLYEAKLKMNNIDYSKIKKKKINVLLSQLCRGDSIENFLSNNDFGDSGMEFVYEWVKCQMKIFFYLYQNKKMKKKANNTVTMSSRTNCAITPKAKTNNAKIKNNTFVNNNQKKCKFNGLSTPKDINIGDFRSIGISGKTTTNFNKNKKSFSVNNSARTNNFLKSKLPPSNTVRYTNLNFENKPSFLMTALPFSHQNKKDYYIDSGYPLFNMKQRNLEISQNRIFTPVEAKKVNFKLKGYNLHKDRIAREIRTAEMLPLLKNRTYHQMRDFFDIKIPINKEIEKRHRKDLYTYALTGKKNEKKIMSLIASGKTELMNYLSLFKLKQILGS
jgi:hypothetical protein